MNEHDFPLTEYNGFRVPRSILDTATAADIAAVTCFHAQWERDGVPANDLLAAYNVWCEDKHLEPFAMAYFQDLAQLSAQAADAPQPAEQPDCGFAAQVRQLLQRAALQRALNAEPSIAGASAAEDMATARSASDELGRAQVATPAQLYGGAPPRTSASQQTAAHSVHVALARQPWGPSVPAAHRQRTTRPGVQCAHLVRDSLVPCEHIPCLIDDNNNCRARLLKLKSPLDTLKRCKMVVWKLHCSTIRSE